MACSLPDTKATASSLPPHQLGVSFPRASESLPMLVQEAVNRLASPSAPGDWVLLQVDVSNAFNCIHRSHLLESATKKAPHLAPWLSTLYGAPLPLLVRGSNDDRISSTRGYNRVATLEPYSSPWASKTSWHNFLTCGSTTGTRMMGSSWAPLVQLNGRSLCWSRALQPSG